MPWIERHSAGALAALALALAAPGADAQELAVPPENQTAVAVTIYNENLALVKDRRRVELTGGAQRLSFVDVSAQIRPETALLSGGLAALAGFSEVSGLKGNLTLDLSAGYGYTGIVVAMLAMLNPLGVIASAIFVAGIFVGADAMSRAAKVPSYIADVMVATSLLTMVVAILLTRYRIRWR